MKREKLTKSHASGVVILIFTVLFVQGVLFLFSKEELMLRKPEKPEAGELSGTDSQHESAVTKERDQKNNQQIRSLKRGNFKSPQSESNSEFTKRKESPTTTEETPVDTSTATTAAVTSEQGIKESPEMRERSGISWKPFSKPVAIQLNTADSAELVSLPGIGPYYAKKILEYRDLLGGFVSGEQLMEIRGIDRERYDLFAGRITADTTLVKKVEIKDATYEQLAKNPYVGGYLARSIIKFRDENAALSTDLNLLLSVNIIKKELYKILKFYFR